MVDDQKKSKGDNLVDKLVDSWKAREGKPDEEWIRISNAAYEEAKKMSPEEIMDRLNALRRLSYGIPAQEFGLLNSLTERKEK